MSEQTQTPEVETETVSTHEEPKKPKNTLFGSIGYDDDKAYENFLSNMDVNQAVFVLIASANFAQARGSFNILESETISTAVRTIRKNSKPAESISENA